MARLIAGEHVVYNFNTNLLDSSEGKMFSFPWYGRGKDVEKTQTDPVKYVIKNGYVSTCGDEEPHYRIWASRFHVYPGDKIIAYNVVLMIRKMPVMYLPVFIQWIEDRPPFDFSYGRSSDWGTHFLTGYNYKINKKHKGTVKFDWREWKGFAYGIDQRYEFDKAEGLYSFYWIEEKDKTIPDFPGLGDGGYVLGRDRWRHKFQHRQELPWDTQALFQLYKVKDSTVLRDYYEKEYSQDTNPETYAYFDKYDKSFSARLLVLKKINKWFTQDQRLPEFDFDIVRTPIGDSGFFVNYRMNVARLNQDAGRNTADLSHDTDRFYSEVELSYPFNVTSWLHAFPYVRLDETFYTHDLHDDDEFRHVTTTGIEFNSKFWRIYDTYNEFLDINQIRHVIEPSVDVMYRDNPNVENSDLFRFDNLDERAGGTRVRFRLDTRLQTKRSNVGSHWVRGRVAKDAFYDPEDLLKLINADLITEDSSDERYFVWKFHQMSEDEFLDITEKLNLRTAEEIIQLWTETHDTLQTNKEDIGLANNNATLLDYFMYIDWLPEENGHSFSDVYAELDITPIDWLTIALDTRYDTRRMDYRRISPFAYIPVF